MSGVNPLLLTIDSGHFKSSEWALPQRPAGCFSLRPCSFISPPQCPSSQLCSAFGELQLSNTICCWLKKNPHKILQFSRPFPESCFLFFAHTQPWMSLFFKFWSWKEKQNCRWVPLRAAAVCCCLRQSRGGCIYSWDTSGKWKKIAFDSALQSFQNHIRKKKSNPYPFKNHHLTSITHDGRRWKVSLCSYVNIPAWISEASRLFELISLDLVSYLQNWCICHNIWEAETRSCLKMHTLLIHFLLIRLFTLAYPGNLETI